MIEGKYPWTYVGRSQGRPVYFNEKTGEIALEDVQEGRLITPTEPVILEEEENDGLQSRSLAEA